MADDRQPPQAYDTVSPAVVGATATNQVSPGTIQEILDTGDRDLIDQAFDKMDNDAITRYLESLPDAPPLVWPLQASSPAGVGSQASHTPSTVSVRTPTPSPSPTTQRRQFTQRTLAAAGAGGGDDDGSGGSRRSTPRGRPDRGRGRGRGRGRRRGGPVRHPGLPWSPASNPATPRGSWSPGSHPRTLGQADLQRRLRMMLQDQEQLAQGRDISTVTMTNSIVTSYKQGGAPSVQTSSSRVSP